MEVLRCERARRPAVGGNAEKQIGEAAPLNDDVLRDIDRERLPYTGHLVQDCVYLGAVLMDEGSDDVDGLLPLWRRDAPF